MKKLIVSSTLLSLLLTPYSWGGTSTPKPTPAKKATTKGFPIATPPTLTPAPYVPIPYAPAKVKQEALKKKTGVDNYVNKLLGQKNECEVSNLSADQLEFINDLKNVSEKMSCEEVKKTNKTTVITVDNLKMCRCLAQDNPNYKEDEKFKKKLVDAATQFTTDNYVMTLISTRLLEYSFAGILKGANGTKALPCDGFVADPSVRAINRAIALDKASANYSYLSLVKNLMSDIDQNKATSIYNFGQEDASLFNAVPSISEADLDYFGEVWGERVGIMSEESSKRVTAFLDVIQDEKVKILSKINLNTPVELGKSNKPATPKAKSRDSEARLAYLEKVLTLDGDGKDSKFLEKVRVAMGKMDSTQGSAKQRFIEAFKSVAAEEFTKSCEKSREAISDIAHGDLSRLMGNEAFMKSLESDGGFSVDAQKMQCNMLQKQFYKDPKKFVRLYCNYRDEGPLSPEEACGDIGDLIGCSFVSANAAGKPEAQADVAPLNQEAFSQSFNNAKASSKIEDELSKVRVTRSASLETIAEKMKREGSVDLSEYKISNTPYANRTASRPKTETGDLAAKGTSADSSFKNVLGQNLKTSTAAPQTLPVPVAAGVTYERKNTILSQPGLSTLGRKKVSLAEDASEDDEDDAAIAKKKKAKKKKKVTNEDEGDEGLEEAVAPNKMTPGAVRKNVIAGTPSAPSFGAQSAPTPAFSGLSGASMNAPASVAAPSAAQARSNPSIIPDESVKQYVQSSSLDSAWSGKGVSGARALSDPHPPEAGLMLTALKTGQLPGKDLTTVTLGEDIADLSALEQSKVFRGAVVLVEDKSKKERYICRAYVGTDLLPITAKTVETEKLSGYKCVSEKEASAKAQKLTPKETQALKKVLANDERLYKAFVLDRILKGSKE